MDGAGDVDVAGAGDVGGGAEEVEVEEMRVEEFGQGGGQGGGVGTFGGVGCEGLLGAEVMLLMEGIWFGGIAYFFSFLLLALLVSNSRFVLVFTFTALKTVVGFVSSLWMFVERLHIMATFGSKSSLIST